MFKEINIGTVIVSIFASLITVHLVIHIELKKFSNSVDVQIKELLNNIKTITINTIKNK